MNLFFFTCRKNNKKWTLLVLEETEIERYIFCIKHLTDLKPLAVKSFEHLDFNNYEVCIYYFIQICTKFILLICSTMKFSAENKKTLFNFVSDNF